MKEVIKILVVEDNNADADLIIRNLRQSEMSFISKIVESKKEFQESLDTFCPDIVLSDFSLPAYKTRCNRLCIQK